MAAASAPACPPKGEDAPQPGAGAADPPPAATAFTVDATVSMGRWVGDSDMEAQRAQHSSQRKTWRAFFTLSLASVGVIYGDIGTSPLYTMASIFAFGEPNEEQILGATCLILWGLTAIVMLKYCCLVLLCDDNGEGGTFALYSLLARAAHISPGNTQSPDAADLQLSRYSSGAGRARASCVGARLRAWFGRSAVGQAGLLLAALLGTSLVLGDSVLTPAQSVLGAVYGLQYKTSLSQNGVVGISCAIVVLLFSLNHAGTVRVGALYAPIVLLWFLLNVLTAIHNIHAFNPGVFKAFSPYYGYLFFAQLRHTGWRALAGVFLAFTGAEATFADIGHFTKGPVRASFALVAWPALMLTYLGQAAWMTKHIPDIPNTFFASIPWGPGFFWVFFVVALLAASVASQAMISGAFQVIAQSTRLGCFPRLTLKHMSPKVASSVYIPEAMWLMMILTIVCICIFRTTTVLGNAYGLCVCGLMVITTLLASLAFLMAFDAHWALVLAFFLLYGFIDCLFLSANLFKVPSGGWFALAIAGGVFAVSLLWWWGTAKKGAHLRASKVRVEDLLQEQPGGKLCLAGTGEPVTRIPGLALLYSDSVLGAPPLLPALLRQWGALHASLVLLTVRRVLIPVVEPGERLLFSHTSLPGVYRAVARYGYMERIQQDATFMQALTQQILLSVRERSAKGALPQPLEASIEGLTARPPVAVLARVTLAAQPTGRPAADFARRLLLDDAYGFLARFARQVSDDWHLDPQQCFEVKQVFRV